MNFLKLNSFKNSYIRTMAYRELKLNIRGGITELFRPGFSKT